MLILWVKQALIAKKIREDVRDIIYNQLVAFDSNQLKAITNPEYSPINNGVKPPELFENVFTWYFSIGSILI
jgi:hypothetical protein